MVTGLDTPGLFAISASLQHIDGCAIERVRGVGRYPMDILICSALGADMYDSVFPTRTARFGVALVAGDSLKLRTKEFANDFRCDASMPTVLLTCLPRSHGSRCRASKACKHPSPYATRSSYGHAIVVQFSLYMPLLMLQLQ